jgi:hypothetical protein
VRLLVVSGDDLAVGGTFYVLVDDYFSYAVCHDGAAGRILHAFYMSFDVCLHRGIFESTVAFRVEGAVLENQVMGIAKGLFTPDVAVH